MQHPFIRKIIIGLHAQSNCKRATFLIEKKANTRLTAREWLDMQAHLAICPLCTLYRQQSKLIQETMLSVFRRRKEHTVNMEAGKKHKIAELIQERLNKGGS